jgi:mannose-6-phosphate isomerase
MTAASASASIAPFRIEPQFVTRVWGYRDLRPWFDRVAEGEPLGEVWLTGDDCLVGSGNYAGKRLADVFSEAGEALTGAIGQEAYSPLLIKVLFAHEKLSVQVHPDDALAQKNGFPRGKTECWYVLSAEPGAEVAVGLNPGTSIDELGEAILNGTLEEKLATLMVHTGDMIFVDAGTVHAIWPGSVLLETQQYCDLTYRMYDYGRPRELHIEKSLEATRTETRAGKVAPRAEADRTVLLDAGHFRVEQIPVRGTRTSAGLRGNGTAPKLAYLFAASGAALITGEGFDPVKLPARGIVAIPASAPKFVLEDAGGLDLIRITPNSPCTTAN